MHILLISDIHGNQPALEAIEHHFKDHNFDCILNCGDSVVYGPFPNETLAWLKEKKSISILGNTDKKVIKLLKGKTFSKPSKPEKRVMYTWTANILHKEQAIFLSSLPKHRVLSFPDIIDVNNKPVQLGLYHGSPEKNHEFLFDTTPQKRFEELALLNNDSIVCCGHSHTPFYHEVCNTHFLNPGSVGRMFDGNPESSCATLTIENKKITVKHHRIPYDIKKTLHFIRKNSLPEIYCEMFKSGKKLN